MNLRELLDLCQNNHVGDWVEVPDNHPAADMVAGVSDPGFKATDIRPLAGNHLAVYIPDPSLSLTWLVPHQPAVYESGEGERLAPEWMEADTTGGWKGARAIREGYVVVLLSGSPVWQEPMHYVTWGGGVGGYVPLIRPASQDGIERGYSAAAEWVTSSWSVGLAVLLSNLTKVSKEWWAHDPIDRLAPEQIRVHPLDGAVF